jgi:hypothetical protein
MAVAALIKQPVKISQNLVVVTFLGKTSCLLGATQIIYPLLQSTAVAHIFPDHLKTPVQCSKPVKALN